MRVTFVTHNLGQALNGRLIRRFESTSSFASCSGGGEVVAPPRHQALRSSAVAVVAGRGRFPAMATFPASRVYWFGPDSPAVTLGCARRSKVIVGTRDGRGIPQRKRD